MDWEGGFSTNSPEFLLLDGDMEEFRSEKSVRTGKSQEEIERLMVDENLSEIERACLLIRTGQDVQRVCVVSHLPELLRSQQEGTLCRVVPILCNSLPSFSAEVQKAASKAFQEIIKQELVPAHILTSAFLPTILSQLDSRDTSVSSAWLSPLLSAIPHLSKDVLKREILNIAVANAQLSQTVGSRQASCQIIGKMAPKFEPYWLKRELLPLAATLCQDVDMEVRQCMCQQLNRLAWALGLDVTKSSILPNLIELTSDEECCVRVAAVETLVELISFLDEGTLRSETVPLLVKFCEEALSAGDSSLLTVARLLGRMCHELKDVMTSEQRDWFVDFYRKLSQFTPRASHPFSTSSSLSLITPSTSDEGMEAECKRLCAYNFPAMLLFTGSAVFNSELSSTFKRLAEDENSKVRRTVASGFHEVTKLLETSCFSVASCYQQLLKDPSVEVLLAVVGHLEGVMESFAGAANLVPETRQPGLFEFIPALLSCEQVASKCRQWRLHEELLKHLSFLVHCMTSDQLYSKFVPLTFKCITGNYVLPVKLAAARTLCLFIRHIRKADQRQELCTRIIEECARSPSCRHRLLFIEICHYLLDIFSRSFFKENFFEAVIKLAHDPVVNIRLRLCRLLPNLKAILKLPGDRALLQQLEQTVRKLISQERDPDASQAIREAVLELDRIEVAMETLTRRTFFEADLIDQQREEEERKLVLAEEREKESSNGGGKGKEGGEGRKVTSAMAKCSPGISKAQLGKKGKSVKSPSVGRKGGSTPSLITPSSTPPSPSTRHKNLDVVKTRRTTPTSIRKTLSSPPATSCEPIRGEDKRGTSPTHLAPGSPHTVPHSGVPLRQKSIDKRPSPQSSPTSSHTSKNRSAANTSPGSTSKLTISQSKDYMPQSTTRQPNSGTSRRKAQQYGVAAYSTGRGGNRKTGDKN